MTTNKCRTGKESGCLDSDKALTEHSVNQQLFAAICFNTLAVAPTLDPTACLANIFGSSRATAPNPLLGFGPRVVVALNTVARAATRRTRSPATARCSRASASSPRTAASSGRSRRCASTASTRRPST